MRVRVGLAGRPKEVIAAVREMQNGTFLDDLSGDMSADARFIRPTVRMDGKAQVRIPASDGSADALGPTIEGEHFNDVDVSASIGSAARSRRAGSPVRGVVPRLRATD